MPLRSAPEQAGRRITHGVLGRRVPRKHRSALNQGMHVLYGTFWGAPPPWEQSPLSLETDLAFHLVSGAVTGAAYDALGG